MGGRPSVLKRTVDGMIEEARTYLAKGAYGIDLLGYRYVGDAVSLNRRIVENVDAPVCIAGSIDSYGRLDEIKSASPWAFTIGGAFFEHKFGEQFSAQIDAVCEYVSK